MQGRSWTLWVRDESDKRHRGIVSLGDEPVVGPPSAPNEFHILLLTKPAAIRTAPDATAICMPRLTRDSVKRGTPAPGDREIVASIKRGELPAALHAQYAAGRIVLPAGQVDATDVFRKKRSVELDRLALLLLDQAHAEALAPYTAIIRRELGVRPGESPLQALEARLSPDDAAERPPARAPGIVRLNAALRRLNAGTLPHIDIETMIEDLRFLRLFERDAPMLDRGGLERLLADVVGTRKRPSTKRKPASILPMRREKA